MRVRSVRGGRLNVDVANKEVHRWSGHEGQVRDQRATVKVAQMSDPDNTTPTVLHIDINSEQSPCARRSLVASGTLGWLSERLHGQRGTRA
jgi:hypothetical protein